MELGPPQQRAVLAVMAAAGDGPVSSSTLADVLWGATPPSAAVATLQQYISRLRRVLEPERSARDPAGVIRRVAGGYHLVAGDDNVDLRRWRTLVARARQLATQGSNEAAGAVYARAAALWSGPVVSDLAPEVRQHPIFAALAHEHVTVLCEAADLALAMGRVHPLIEALDGATGWYALDEGLQARALRVLAAAGRRAEALQRFRRLRDLLIRELGIEPGPLLQQAHQAVLAETPPTSHQLASVVGAAASWPAHLPADLRPFAGQDVELDGLAELVDDLTPLGMAPPASPLRPAQLPADLPTFIGRRAELTQALASHPERTEAPEAVAITVIAGMAGVGKTAFAVHWAHQVAYLYSDGQLYLNLRGFDPIGQPVSPDDALYDMLTAMGVGGRDIPAGLDARSALFRTRVAGRRVLIVLDNARDLAQVRPLLPGSAGCLVIITSRNQLVGLVAAEGANLLTLGVLTAAEARDFLARRIGADRTAREDPAAREIIDQCAGLPLALAIVAARAVAQVSLPLQAIAAELVDTHGGLDAFGGLDPAIDARSVISWSYRSLSPVAAMLGRFLGAHPGTDISAGAAASLLGLPVRQVRAVLNELTRAHLVDERTAGRYGMHDLLHSYAAELLATDPDHVRHGAVLRLLDHYLHTAFRAALLLSPTREPIALTDPASGVVTELVKDSEQALAWFTTEYSVLLSMVDRAESAGLDTHVYQLAWTLDTFQIRQGRGDEQVATRRSALAAAQRRADPRLEADAHRDLGHALTRAGQMDEARQQFTEALGLYAQLGDPAGQAHVHRGIGYLHFCLGEWEEILRHVRRAHDLYAAAGNVVGQAKTLNESGFAYARLARYPEALKLCRQALRLFRELGDEHGGAACLDSLGYAYRGSGQHQQAIACYQEAAASFGQLGDLINQATTVAALGDTLHDAREENAARDAWQRALTMYEELGHADAESVRARLARS
ncbi:AfsR/SARP family transcriptional regulator [Rugosimonospora acidiphila]|uniref:AfsR/SARP family transcriptional regulator n=1 Tax=Rugosimonospora acidiphila TaxID=556531 RepID=UPI0031E9D24A